MFNQKSLSLLILAVFALTLAGCGGGQPKTDPNFGDAYKAANQIGQDINNAATVDSERNINNIITMMNYSGNETDTAKLKTAIKKGMADGKIQAQMDREIIGASAKAGDNLGSGYMLGYTFGCQAVTGDEDKCSTSIGAQYQQIIIEEMQKQVPTPAQ